MAHNRILKSATTALLLAPIFAFIPSSSAVLQNFSEDFEDDDLTALPSANFYAFTVESGGAGSTSQAAVVPQSLNGSKSVKSTLHAAAISGGDAISKWDFSTVSLDPCGSSNMTFAFRFILDSMSGSSSNYNLVFKLEQFGGGSGAFIWQLRAADTDSQILVKGGTGVSSSVIGGITVNKAEQYNATFYPRCNVNGLANFGFTLHNATAGTFFASSVSQAVPINAGFPWTFQVRVTDNAGQDAVVRVDDLVLRNAESSIQTFSATAEATVTGLVGFDVDPIGETVIARLNSGANVSTFNALTMAQIGGPLETNCNRVDGVDSQLDNGVYVTLFHCDPGDPTTIELLKIRTGALGDPVFANCSWCDKDIDTTFLTSSFNNEFDVNGRQIGEIVRFPASYTNSEGLSAFGVRNVAWSFSSTSGFIGVAMYSNFNNDVDDRHVEKVSYASASPDQICSFQIDGEAYIGAAQASNPAKLYRVDFTPPTVNSGLDADMTLVGVQSISGGTGIACAQSRVLIALELTSGDQVIMLDAPGLSSNSSWPGPRSVTTQPRGVALSGDGLWAAWVNGTKAEVAHASNGTVVAQYTLPSGTFKGMALSNRGQNLWVATSTKIALYSIYNATTGTPQSDFGCTDCAGGQAGGPPTTGALANADTQLAAAFGVPVLGAQLFLGFLLIAMVSVGTMTAVSSETGQKKGMGILAAVGGVLGFVVAYSVGFIPRTFVFVVVVLIAAVIALRVYLNKGG